MKLSEIYDYLKLNGVKLGSITVNGTEVIQND